MRFCAIVFCMHATEPATRAANRCMRLSLIALAFLACATPPPARQEVPVQHAAAAPAPEGYVADGRCADCHASMYASFQGVGMARSMVRPRVENLIEDLGTPFFHEPSQRHYELIWSEETLRFRRWQLDERGGRIHQIELPVDWIVGSGYRSRVYLYRTPSGELYQLPIAWYPQEKGWGMAPGFDRPDHEGVERAVRRECLFCHNAYPAVGDGSDAKWAPHAFPAAMPEGIGCQRCHGPGAAHIRSVVDGGSMETVRATIVNPARLTPEKRDSVCFQCHMLPAVGMIGVRRFDRGVYSFRPGESLADYMLHVDVDERDQSREDRFEINHHAYRLTQSPCHQIGKLTCIDCHDPHQPLRTDSRLAKANDVCLRCHERHALPTSTGTATADPANCTGCHMPRRRTQDVVHVTMTDHRIERAPAVNLLAPLAEHEPAIHGVTFFDQASAPSGEEADIYRAVTILRANALAHAPRAYLEQALPETTLTSTVPWLDLIAAELQQRRFAEAERLIALLPEKERTSALARGWLGIARVGLGRPEEALADLRAAVDGAPEVPDTHFNLGLVLHRSGSHEEALEHLDRALALRPNLVNGWFARAEALEALGRNDDAIEALRKALAIRPTHTRAQASLERLTREPE